MRHQLGWIHRLADCFGDFLRSTVFVLVYWFSLIINFRCRAVDKAGCLSLGFWLHVKYTHIVSCRIIWQATRRHTRSTIMLPVHVGFLLMKYEVNPQSYCYNAVMSSLRFLRFACKLNFRTSSVSMSYSMALTNTVVAKMQFLFFSRLPIILRLVVVLFMWHLWMAVNLSTECHIKKIKTQTAWPKCTLLYDCLISDWYSKLSSVVRWNGVFSPRFSVNNGVRQGSILSAILFNIYINDLIQLLQSSNLGCNVSDKYFGCIMYADDIILLSTSVCHLQKLLNLCDQYGSAHNIVFHASKSVYTQVGFPCHRAQVTRPMYLGNMQSVWVNCFKYLGSMLPADRSLSVEHNYTRMRFYVRVRVFWVIVNMQVKKLQLIKSFCLPVLTYCIGTIRLSKNQIRALSVCWNDVFRKKFWIHEVGVCKRITVLLWGTAVWLFVWFPEMEFLKTNIKYVNSQDSYSYSYSFI